MPAVGKEVERPFSPESSSPKVERVGYVERVEKQTENKQQDNGTTSQNVTSSVQSTNDMGKIVSAQFSVQQKPKIVLPLRKAQIEDGLHQKVNQGVRWLSEWCVMMIKKYPGRVFYLPSENR